MFTPLAAILLAATTAASPSSSPSELTSAIDRVVVFKDGYGLFVRNGTAIADDAGEVFTYEVPDAVLGAFWAQAEGRELKGMRAEWVDGATAPEERSCLNTLELLRANPNRPVTVTTDKAEFTGKLVDITPPRSIPLEAEEETPSRSTLPYPRAGDLVVLDTSTGRVALPAGSILAVRGNDLSIRCLGTDIPKRRRLTFSLGKGAAHSKVSLRVFHFSPGIRWIPTYRLQTGDRSTADLSLQGELVNDVADLKEATLELMVGVPNFKFKDVRSPLSLEREVQNSMRGMNHGAYSNALMTQMPMAKMARADSDETSGAAPELSGEQTQDFFTYSLKGVALPRGARAVMPLWTHSVPQRHVYTLDLALRYDRGSGDDDGSDEDRAPRVQKNPIWHQLELSNQTKEPWTTGAALALQNDRPLAQELLTYTPAGAKTLLPLTIATDLQASRRETLLERRENAKRVNGSDLTLVRKKGVVRIRSFRKESSATVVTLNLGGNVTAPGAQIQNSGYRSEDGVPTRLNGHATVRWEATIGAGETKTFEYTVEVYE